MGKENGAVARRVPVVNDETRRRAIPGYGGSAQRSQPPDEREVMAWRGFLDLLEASPRIHRVPVERPLEHEAEQLLRQFRHQRFSYVDAVSFAVMRSLAVTDAFAFDQHFSTAGFVRVPAA